MDLELRHLRAFAAVADTRSFTAASRQLLITQPALSRTVQQLERIVAVRLVDRTSRTVELTEAGTRFRVRAQAILRELDLAVAEVQGERELRIGFSWVLPDPWARDVVTAFEELTGARVRLLRRDDIGAAIELGEVDVAFTRRPLPGGQTRVLTLFDEPRVAAVSTASALAGLQEISWSELARHPVVVNTVSGSTRPGLWSPGERPAQIVECGNYDEWIALVAADRGVGATPVSASFAYAHAGVTFIPLTGAPPVPLHLAWVPRREGLLVRRFVEAALARPFVAITGSTHQGAGGEG